MFSIPPCIIVTIARNFLLWGTPARSPKNGHSLNYAIYQVYDWANHTDCKLLYMFPFIINDCCQTFFLVRHTVGIFHKRVCRYHVLMFYFLYDMIINNMHGIIVKVKKKNANTSLNSLMSLFTSTGPYFPISRNIFGHGHPQNYATSVHWVTDRNVLLNVMHLPMHHKWLIPEIYWLITIVTHIHWHNQN